jgi:hypothetical protein
MKTWVKQIAGVVACAALTVGVASAATVTFGTDDADNILEVGEPGAVFFTFASTDVGAGTNSGQFVISDASVTELVANVNALPMISFTSISIDNGASVVDITPGLPSSPGPNDSISFRVTGLAVGTYTMTFGTVGRGTLSGQLARVPAPGTLALLGIGLVGLGLIRRKNQS